MNSENPEDFAILSIPFTRYRPDGWPLCPQCGEDELWSPLEWLGEESRPPLEEWIAAGMQCYRCGWKYPESESHAIPYPFINMEPFFGIPASSLAVNITGKETIVSDPDSEPLLYREIIHFDNPSDAFTEARNILGHPFNALTTPREHAEYPGYFASSVTITFGDETLAFPMRRKLEVVYRKPVAIAPAIVDGNK